MPPKLGNSLYGLDGSTHRLAQELGRGGQGSVWSLSGDPNLVAKFYHNGISPDVLKKLEAMCRLKSESLNSIAAWPITLLKETKSGAPQGLLMRRITGFYSVNQLYGIKSRLRAFPEAQFPFLLHAAMNTARAFATIHDAGQVVGDVNHSNLMISQTATVAMIDCDSFQISSNGKVYLCPVGVPEFTPPELQGGSFAGKMRTAQHDAFGLSVLIFYLLFLGRHPFMGVYDVKASDMLGLEQAITQYKFPYALNEQSAEVRLPPFVPRLVDYPGNVGELFKRAFTRDAQLRGRPTAQEWVSTLSGLTSATKQCRNNPSHHYFSGLSQCPWCRVEGVIGSAIFGVKLTSVRDENFNLVAVWAQIEAVTPVTDSLQKPDVKLLQAKYTPDPTLTEILKRRRRFREYALFVLAAVLVVALAELTAAPAAIAITTALIVCIVLWKKGNELSKSFRDRFKDAEDAFDLANGAFEKAAAVPEAYRKEKEKLTACKQEFEGLGEAKAKRIRLLEASREQKQRQHFLERFRIEDERIPNVGPKNKIILAAWGIEDAWDVDDRRISQIKGFGPVKRQSLMTWRKEKERLFRFEAAQPVDARDLHAVDQEFIQKSGVLKNTLSSGPQILRQALAVWQAQRRQALSTLNLAADRLAHAQVDIGALRRF